MAPYTAAVARRALSRIERRAIWQAGGCVCAYCGDPLRYRDVEIDHIVPQSLDFESFAQLRAQQGLPEDFDINGYGNLAAACSVCNRKKSAHSFRAGRIAIELANASRLTRQVAALVAQFIRQSEADKVRFMLAEALSTGRLSPVDLRDMAGVDFRKSSILSEHPSLFAELDLEAIDDQAVSKFRNTRTGPEDGVDLRDIADQLHATVYTISEYEAAVADGLFAYSRYDRSMAFRYFETPSRVLNYLRRAEYADESFVRYPRRGVCDIALLPATLLVCGPYESDEDHQRDLSDVEGKSIGDLVTDGKAHVVGVDSDSVAVVHGNCRISLTELLRADFNGDGIEDLLVSFGMSLVEGSFGHAQVLCLRRLSSAGPFEIAQPI